MNPCIRTGADVLLLYSTGNMRLHGDLYAVGSCIVLHYVHASLRPCTEDEGEPYDWAHAIFYAGAAYGNAEVYTLFAPDILDLTGAQVLIVDEKSVRLHNSLIGDINESVGKPRDWDPDEHDLAVHITHVKLGDEDDADNGTRQ